MHDVLVVVVAQGTTQLVIIHVGFALPVSPLASDFVRIQKFEFAIVPFPFDTRAVFRRVGQQFQQELPQLDLTATITENG